ncbi:MAG: M14 family zinc carboxypeptidase [Ferruginibacter sp.]
MKKINYILVILFAIILCTSRVSFSQGVKVQFINTAFENASQFNWEIDSNGSIVADLIYDHERSSANRANQHWNFQVQATPGADLTFILRNFDNIWNGKKSLPISERTPCFISRDNKNWSAIKTELISGNRLRFNIHMDGEKLYVASVEPYRISDLQKLISAIKNNPLVDIKFIGKTSEGRPLEIIRIGNPNAPYCVFLRGRAHGWESGGNWVEEGLIRGLLQKDAGHYLKKYCVYILPMANKDAVAQGRTRFNARGMDLNRNWDKPADLLLCPENYFLENWLRQMISKGKKPDLAIDLHNDANGQLHVSHPNGNSEKYFSNAKRFESLLRRHTWFTEGTTGADFRNPGSIGEGLVERFGIDAFILEFNFEWIAGLKKVPFSEDWELMGKKLRDVFLDYFKEDD